MNLGEYTDELLYSYKCPNNKGRLTDADISAFEENATCGDAIMVYLKIHKNKITDVKFDGAGCVISLGAADMVADYIKGKDIDEIYHVDKGSMLGIINLDPGPARIRCMSLFLRATKNAILEYKVIQKVNK